MAWVTMDQKTDFVSRNAYMIIFNFYMINLNETNVLFLINLMHCMI